MAIWVFGWKHLDKSSEDLQLDLKLRESQSWTLLHEYPKLMWDNNEHDKPGLFKFFENEN